MPSVTSHSQKSEERVLHAWKLHTCFSREPAAATSHSHTHHHSWFSVITNFCWPRHWRITSPAERVSQLVGRAFIFQWDMIWYALKVHETYLSSNEHSKGRKAILRPAEQSVRKWSRLILRCVETASVNNHCKHIGCYAHSLENDPPGTAQGRTHPFKIWGGKCCDG